MSDDGARVQHVELEDGGTASLTDRAALVRDASDEAVVIAEPPMTERAGRRRRRASVSIGRVLGIDIRVHATFVVLVVLVVLGAAGRGIGALAGELAWLTALFASVAAHELAHSVVARRRGAIVRDIVLLPIGGVSELERMPVTPADELRVAAAGPLMSIALGVGLGVLALGMGEAMLPPRLSGGPFLARLAWVNLLLGAFNLLPAFPMDGGRLLRAELERRRDALSATRIAARVGRAFAVGMVAAGIVWNPWLLVIGVFVWFGGAAEELTAVVHDRLRTLHVVDLLAPTTVVDGATPCWHAAALAAEAGCREIAVTDDGVFVGIAGIDGLLAAPSGTPCRTVAVGGSTVRPSDRVDPDAIAALAATEAGIVGVVDGDVVVGVLRAVDVEQVAKGSPGTERTSNVR